MSPIQHEKRMIPDRLKNRSDFLRVRKGKKNRGKHFFMEYMPRDDGTDMPRYGLTVSKKCGNAPARNRIKRRLRHALDVYVMPDMAHSTDYVIVSHRELIAMPFQNLVAQLQNCVRSAS